MGGLGPAAVRSFQVFGSLGIRKAQLSHEKNPGWLGYIGDYRDYRDY